MPVEPASAELLAARGALVDRWLEEQLATNPVFVALDRPDERRWYVRMRGDDREFVAIVLTLGEYTLQWESYVLPAPEENVAETYEYLLRANRTMYGMGFAIGPEDALYLMGHMPVEAVDDGELDRIVGSTYVYVERHFRAAMRLGFASRFQG